MASVTRITLPSNPELWVDMRDRFTYGARRRMQDALIKVSVAEGTSDQMTITPGEMSSATTALLCYMITAWNVTDDAGNVLPITSDGLDELDANDADLLIAEANKRAAARTDVAPFDSASPRSSTVGAPSEPSTPSA